jgi:HD-GYP domain-containing protein (c-di-GMP phosphodiesterase class II)
MIHDKLNYTSLLEKFESKKTYGLNIDFVDLGKKDQLLNLAIHKKQIVIGDHDLLFEGQQYKHLLNHMAQEIFCPIFSFDRQRKEVVGCLYLGSENAKPKFSELISEPSFANYILKIDSLYNNVYNQYNSNRNLLIYLNTISEIYRNHCQRIDHPYNVAFWCSLIAKQIGLSEPDCFKLNISAILHDVGILLVPQHIVNKPGKLNEDEDKIIKKHPIYGYNLTRDLDYSVPNLNNIDDIIRHHHERYDGTGYPDGLKGESIPFMSRIIAIADAADAMLSLRPYKETMPIKDVIRELSACKGTQFDPYLIDAIIYIFEKQQEDISSVLGTMAWGSMIISTDKGSCNFQGDIIKKEHGFEFISGTLNFENTNLIDISEIRDCIVIIERNGKFYEFTAFLKKISANKIDIESIQYQPKSQYFSLYWDLFGEIHEQQKYISEISIKKIGGNLINCYLLENVPLKLNQIYTITIKFDDGEYLSIPGKNLRAYEYGTYMYYDFEFNNLNESIRTKIFKQIFKKQAEKRQSIFKVSSFFG